jgi:hypothetical protein
MADPTVPPSGNDSGNADTNRPNGPARTDARKIADWLGGSYLSYTLEDNGEAVLIMDDFLQITTLTGDKSYFTEVIITLCLALSTKKNDISDTAVFSYNTAFKLYLQGIGRHSIDDVDTMGPVRSLLLNESKQWIIVPCSDGIKHGVDHADEFFEAKEERVERERLAKDKMGPKVADPMDIDAPGDPAAPTEKVVADKGAEAPKEAVIPPPMHQHGAHWGILIVDKEKNVAHYVDSHLDLREIGTGRQRRWKLRHMFHSATVAGKVLCGIDDILATQEGHEKGNFDATTLKYTPHDRNDNSFSGRDDGPCGPFMFAFLEHFGAKTDLRAAFRRSRKGRLRFNSKVARDQLRALVEQEVAVGEGLPYQLNVDLLRILNALPYDHVKKIVRDFRGEPEHVPRLLRLVGDEIEVESSMIRLK